MSPYPPALARKRLAASGFFDQVAQGGNVFLWSLNLKARPGGDPASVSSPVTSLWEAFWLHRGTGRLADDPNASGWGLLFEEETTPDAPLGQRYRWAQGNIAVAKAGRDKPGFLSFGPHKTFPPGRYLARFRLRRGARPPAGLGGGVHG